MGFVIFNKRTGEMRAWNANTLDDSPDPEAEVVVELPMCPERRLHRWNDPSVPWYDPSAAEKLPEFGGVVRWKTEEEIEEFDRADPHYTSIATFKAMTELERDRRLPPHIGWVCTTCGTRTLSKRCPLCGAARVND